MSKLLPKLYATLRVIECTDVDKTVEEMKKDLCVKVSGQEHWHEMDDNQKHTVLRMAIQEKELRIGSQYNDGEVEEVGKYKLSELINAITKSAEEDLTPRWGDLVVLWNELSSRQDYIKWVKSSIAFILSQVPNDTARNVAISDFAHETGERTDYIEAIAKAYEVFGLGEVHANVPFDVCLIMSKSEDPMRLLYMYKEDPITIGKLRGIVRKENAGREHSAG